MDPRANSVGQLSELYNVLIGIALSVAIFQSFSNGTGGLISVANIPASLPNLLIFMVLVIPFYHGAVRHLFATYVENGGSTRIKNGALLADFILLFLEGCLFVLMAMSVGNVHVLVWIVVALLVLDSIWGFLAWLAFTGAQSQFAEKTWAIINVVTASFLVAFILTFDDFSSDPDRMIQLSVVIAIVLTLRTIVDYAKTWDFYFPPNVDSTAP